MLISAFSALGGAKLKSKKTAISIILLLSSAIAGCSTTGNNSNFGASGAALGGPVKPGQKPQAGRSRPASAQTAALAGGRRYSAIGRASWYGSAFQGKRTANGEIFNMYKLTAAHRGLPLPSYARVTNLQNGSSLIVRINDRGPYTGNRIIDLSQQAAQLLDYHHGGLADVKVDYVGPAPAGGHDEAFLRASYRPPAASAAAAGAAAAAKAGGKTALSARPADEAKGNAPLPFKAAAADEAKPAQAAIAAAAGAADSMKTAAAPVPAAKPAEAAAEQKAAAIEIAEAAPQAEPAPADKANQPQRPDPALNAGKAGKARQPGGGGVKPALETAAVKAVKQAAQF